MLKSLSKAVVYFLLSCVVFIFLDLFVLPEVNDYYLSSIASLFRLWSVDFGGLNFFILPTIILILCLAIFVLAILIRYIDRAERLRSRWLLELLIGIILSFVISAVIVAGLHRMEYKVKFSHRGPYQSCYGNNFYSPENCNIFDRAVLTKSPDICDENLSLQLNPARYPSSNANNARTSCIIEVALVASDPGMCAKYLKPSSLPAQTCLLKLARKVKKETVCDLHQEQHYRDLCRKQYTELN